MTSEKTRKGLAKGLCQAALYGILDELKTYAAAHRELYGSPIGEDYVLGMHWLNMADALVGLLNGETGAIDCGAFDGEVRGLAREQGFTEQEADNLEWGTGRS